MYVRAHEKLLAPIISHFSTPYFHSPSSPIKIPSPPTFFFTSSRCLLIHFRLSTKRRLVFRKTTARFPQNNGSFFTKRRLVFHKMTACFSPKQGCHCSTTKLSDIYSLGKSSYYITHIFKKKTLLLCQKKHYLYICTTHSHLKTFFIWMLIK